MWINSLCDRLSDISAGLFPPLLDTTLKGLAILLLTAIATLAMRRSSAAARHLVWFLGTISLLVLPILSVTLPGWYILPRWIAESSPPPRRPEVAAMVMPSPVILPPVPDVQLLPNYTPPKAAIKVPAFAPPSPIVVILPAPQPAMLAWKTWVILAWVTGSVFSFAFILFGSLSLWQLRRRSLAVTDRRWTSLVRNLCIQIRFRRPVELISSRRRAMPMTWGFWKTWILVPADSADWTTEQRTVVLMHELAHARRFDCLTQFCTQLVFAIYWFNPLIWIARRQMQIERERACDDLVLATGTRASAYAEQVLRIAAEMSPIRYSAAAIAMARQSTLEERLLAILDIKRNRRAISWTAAIAAMILTALVAAPLSMLHADSTPESQAMRATERFAERYGWKAQTVTPTTLESKFGGWRNLPFSLSGDEEADVKKSVELAGNAHSYANGVSEFSNSNTRSALEAILKKRPDAFYIEFLLAHWYRDDGDVAKADRLRDASYRHAPVILVQRFEYQDGSPAADTPIATFSIECNRVQNGSLDPSLKLAYCDLKTDADGCVYLPTYSTVYRRYSMSWPNGYTAHFPSLGWFETSKKIALLPVATISPNAGDFTAASEAPLITTGTLSDGNAAKLLAVSPYPDPDKQWWLPDGSPSPRQYTTGEPGISPWPQENGRRFVFRFSKPLADDAHIQFRFSAPTISQVHYFFTEPNDGIEKLYVLLTHFPTHPKTVTLRLGEASGRWQILASRDPKIHSTIDPLPAGFAVTEAAIIGDSDASELTIEHPQTDLELRVFAIDNDQVEHAAGGTSLMTSGSIIKDGFRFEHLPLARIHHFLIEERTFQWTDFSNIAIQPAANSNKPPAAPSTQPAASGTENSPHSATYRMYDPAHPELAVQVKTKDRRCRQELPDGKVVIIDNGTGTAVLLDTKRKTFTGLAPLDTSNVSNGRPQRSCNRWPTRPPRFRRPLSASSRLAIGRRTGSVLNLSSGP